jgi:hypothetical protein
MPLFLGGVGINSSDVFSTDIDLLSLSNIPPGSPRMWVHVASVYLITFLALKVGFSGGTGGFGGL